GAAGGVDLVTSGRLAVDADGNELTLDVGTLSHTSSSEQPTHH
ncbi:MAG: hypothetical protein RL097_428, partial [Candidatus Parcubacteria bacterium]